MMFENRVKLLKIFGFEVKVDISWIIIALLVTWSLAESVFPLYNPDLSQQIYWILGVAGTIGLFGSIIFHELCHSLVARKYGLPMRGITLFIFGGVAEMDEEPTEPKVEFFMALAGPLASIALGALCFILLGIGKTAHWPSPAIMILSYLGTINIFLAIFNLIPAFPLDGGRIFRSLLWYRKKNLLWATSIASGTGSGFGLFLIILGAISALGGGIISGIWWVLIGMFLRSASKMSYQSVLIRDTLQGEPVEKFMDTHAVTVSPDASVDEVVEDYFYKYDNKMYPVIDEFEHVKYITVSDVRMLPRNEWKSHHVTELAHNYTPETAIGRKEDAMKALSIMNKTGNNQMMVIDNGGKLVGTVAMKDLIHYLSDKMEIEKDGFPKNDQSE
jgi:Zn-dependent protease/predicted transcriptional regulator